MYEEFKDKVNHYWKYLLADSIIAIWLGRVTNDKDRIEKATAYKNKAKYGLETHEFHKKQNIERLKNHYYSSTVQLCPFDQVLTQAPVVFRTKTEISTSSTHWIPESRANEPVITELSVLSHDTYPTIVSILAGLGISTSTVTVEPTPTISNIAMLCNEEDNPFLNSSSQWNRCYSEHCLEFKHKDIPKIDETNSSLSWWNKFLGMFKQKITNTSSDADKDSSSAKASPQPTVEPMPTPSPMPEINE